MTPENKRKQETNTPLWIEKYRPKQFSEMTGQEEILRHLLLFADHGNIPHMLFVGPHGTGKSVALECMAKKLYGDNWSENTSILNTGEIFRLGKSYFQDNDRFVHLFKKNASLITNFKHVVKWYASMRPLDADFKLMIFEDAGSLTFEAQQALRRIMERYSSTCRFIFLATNQSAIIPAISSRCLPLFFAPLLSEEIHSKLTEILEAENIKDDRLSKDEIDLIVEASQGDCRKAITYLQIILSSGNNTNLAELSRSETGALTASLFGAVMSGDLNTGKQVAENLMIDYGLSGREILEELRIVAMREYNDPRIAIAIADTDYSLGHAGNEFIQLNSLLAQIIKEVFI